VPPSRSRGTAPDHRTSLASWSAALPRRFGIQNLASPGNLSPRTRPLIIEPRLRRGVRRYRAALEFRTLRHPATFLAYAATDHRTSLASWSAALPRRFAIQNLAPPGNLSPRTRLPIIEPRLRRGVRLCSAALEFRTLRHPATFLRVRGHRSSNSLPSWSAAVLCRFAVQNLAPPGNLSPPTRLPIIEPRLRRGVRRYRAALQFRTLRQPATFLRVRGHRSSNFACVLECGATAPLCNSEPCATRNLSPRTRPLILELRLRRGVRRYRAAVEPDKNYLSPCRGDPAHTPFPLPQILPHRPSNPRR
jgi:hypothetical protein